MQSDHNNNKDPLSRLHEGPRLKSEATRDFEIIARAFLAESPPAYRLNRLQEIEVDVAGIIGGNINNELPQR